MPQAVVLLWAFVASLPRGIEGLRSGFCSLLSFLFHTKTIRVSQRRKENLAAFVFSLCVKGYYFF